MLAAEGCNTLRVWAQAPLLIYSKWLVNIEGKRRGRGRGRGKSKRRGGEEGGGEEGEDNPWVDRIGRKHEVG